MFQSYALFPHMTVERNIAYGLEQERLPKAEIAERVGAVIDSARLGDFAKAQARSAFGRPTPTCCLGPRLGQTAARLLLDEPLSALDKKLRERNAAGAEAPAA